MELRDITVLRSSLLRQAAEAESGSEWRTNVIETHAIEKLDRGYGHKASLYAVRCWCELPKCRNNPTMPWKDSRYQHAIKP